MSYLSHIASLGFPSFAGVDEGPADGADRQTVAAALPAAEMLQNTQRWGKLCVTP